MFKDILNMLKNDKYTVVNSNVINELTFFGLHIEDFNTKFI